MVCFKAFCISLFTLRLTGTSPDSTITSSKGVLLLDLMALCVVHMFMGTSPTCSSSLPRAITSAPSATFGLALLPAQASLPCLRQFKSEASTLLSLLFSCSPYCPLLGAIQVFVSDSMLGVSVILNSLQPWDKSHLIMVYDPLMYC